MPLRQGASCSGNLNKVDEVSSSFFYVWTKGQILVKVILSSLFLKHSSPEKMILV